MKRRLYGWTGVMLAIALAGCAGAPRPGGDARWIDPSQAVQLAAAAPRTGVTGVFALTVQSTGKADRLYLDSERDYRDPRNLAIGLSDAVAKRLQERLGANLGRALRGRRILVAGTARRVRIDFVVDGRLSGKYYYQTQLQVNTASQIQLL